MGRSQLLLLAVVTAFGTAPAAPTSAATLAQPEMSCQEDPTGDSGGVLDVVEHCVGLSSFTAALSVRFAGDVSAADLSDVAVEFADSQGNVVSMGQFGVNESDELELFLSDFFGRVCATVPAMADNTSVTVPVIPARCAAAPLDSLFWAVVTFSTGSFEVRDRAPDAGPEGAPSYSFIDPPAATTVEMDAADATDASVAMSQLLYPDGGARTALLARADEFADALASGGAQGALGAPLLLTAPDRLDPRVRAELDRLGVEKVFALGGENALSAAVVADLGRESERLSGASRLETAAAIAERFRPTFTNEGLSEAGALVARAFPSSGGDPTAAFADALAAGAHAAALVRPLLLSETARLSTPAQGYLADLQEFAGVNVALIGGPAALSEQVAADARAAHPSAEVTRVAGDTRFATATAIAQRTAGARPPVVVVVDATRPDAWVSGFTAAVLGWAANAVVVLSAGDDLPQPTVDYLAALEVAPAFVCTPSVTPAACSAAAS